MILINKLQRPFVLTLMLLLAPVATVAHHAYTAEFDTTKPVKVSGVLTKVEWSNPHIWIYLDVKDATATLQIGGFPRLKHIDPTTVSYEITIDDPKIFTHPWSQTFQMKLHPTWSLLEQVCEENNRCQGGNCDSQKPR